MSDSVTQQNNWFQWEVFIWVVWRSSESFPSPWALSAHKSILYPQDWLLWLHQQTGSCRGGWQPGWLFLHTLLAVLLLRGQVRKTPVDLGKKTRKHSCISVNYDKDLTFTVCKRAKGCGFHHAPQTVCAKVGKKLQKTSWYLYCMVFAATLLKKLVFLAVYTISKVFFNKLGQFCHVCCAYYSLLWSRGRMSSFYTFFDQKKVLK